ncbi:MAG: hypothetical protein ABR547_10140 [Halanaerobium sp.]
MKLIYPVGILLSQKSGKSRLKRIRKRLKEDIKLKLNNNNLDQVQEIEGFKIGAIEIKLQTDKLQAELQDELLEFSYPEFIQNPRAILNQIMELAERIK